MTRTPRTARAKPNATNTTPNQPSQTPKSHKRHSQNTSTPSKHTNFTSQAPATGGTHVLSPAKPVPAVMGMAPEARLEWNLRVLRRHDPLITRIFDQAPYAVLYTFNHTHAHDPDGGKGRKYEGNWEKTGIEGTVFIVERNEAPHYGFFILNRGGPASIIQVFHKDDTIELGADPRFLTFRPGAWDRAYTPYSYPYATCEKPTLICLWLSDGIAGPRFAYFMTRTKEYLARQAREAEQGSTSSPPLTPLSQVHYLSDEDDVHDEQSFASQQETFMQEANVSSAIVSKPASLPQENPLDRLFAGLTEPPLGSRSTLTSTAQPLVDGIPQNHPLLPAFVPHAPEIQAGTATTAPAGFSLLDQLFASAANEVAEPNTKAVLPIATTITAAAVSRAIDAPSTPPQTHQNTAAVAQSIAPIYDSRHDSDDEIIVVQQTRGRLSSTSRAAPAPDAEEYQELEPPSPSKIPNPLHTPAVHLSSRQKQRRRRGPSRPRRGPAHQAIDLDHEDLPALPPIRGSSRPPQPKQHYIPDNTKEESKLDKEAIATSLLNAHVERMTHDGAPYPTLPKYEFVSEILTLIHKDPAFVSDLYSRYESMKR